LAEVWRRSLADPEAFALQLALAVGFGVVSSERGVAMLRSSIPTSISRVGLSSLGEEARASEEDLQRGVSGGARGRANRASATRDRGSSADSGPDEPLTPEPPFGRLRRRVIYIVVCVLYALGLSFMDIFFSQVACGATATTRMPPLFECC
jgi:hypothetical protein